MARYFEVDRGRFEATLVRYDFPQSVAVAYTDYDCVRLADAYVEADRKAVEDFAAQYDLPIDWNRR